MTPSTVVLLLTSAAVALAVLPITHSSSLDIAEPDLGNTALLADDWSTIETAIDDELEGLDIECDTFDGLDTDDGTNSTLGPSPGMMRIAYGTQWKKGLLQWVAFPQMGLLSCKKTAILGRKMVGKKYVRPASRKCFLSFLFNAPSSFPTLIKGNSTSHPFFLATNQLTIFLTA